MKSSGAFSASGVSGQPAMINKANITAVRSSPNVNLMLSNVQVN